MVFSTLTVTSAATLLFLAMPIFGQGTTTANCTTNLWSINQHKQSPCLVAAGLETVCQGQSFNIPALLPGQRYSGPPGGGSNKCICSTVVYSLVSACGLCQGNDIQTWDQWKINCSENDISISSFPVPIPKNVAIPAWAYQNVTASGVFNAIEASQLASQNPPDSTAAPSPTGSSGVSGKKKSDAGAIAGGVVGGVLGLTFIVLGAFFLYKRHSRIAPSAKFMRGEKYDIAASPAFGARAGSATPALPMQTAPPKLYDPSDPSTFPTSPAPTYPTYPSNSPFEGSTLASDSLYTSPGYTSPQPLLSVYSHHTSPSQSGRYNGVPEV